MTFQGCVGRRRSDSCIPVISVSIDLPVHTCTQVYLLFMKNISILQASKSFTYRIFNDVLATFMTTILSIKLTVVRSLTPTGLNVLNAMVIDIFITNQGSQVHVIIV